MQSIWDGIREGMGFILAFFYSIVPNAGFAIIMLTVVVRLILFPLTAKQAKSMIAMQRAQPGILPRPCTIGRPVSGTGSLERAVPIDHHQGIERSVQPRDAFKVRLRRFD